MRLGLAHVGVLVAVLAFGSSARAVDGVIEINQAKAIAGGVTATDTPGFPVTIDAAGSYRLTGNLTTVGNVDGIAITGANVVLDLNGFTISGDNVCVGLPVMNCTFQANPMLGAGVRITQTGVTVRNGAVIGNRGPGLFGNPGGVSSGLVVEDVLARSNGFFGVATGSAFGRVARCRGIGNWGGGIGLSGPGGTAIDNESNGNSLVGLNSTGGGNAIFRNLSLSNGGAAFVLDPADLASWNYISDAAIGGISTLDNRCAGGLC
jgi:hypothetical protein